MTEHAPQPTPGVDTSADRAALDAAERRIMDLEMQLLHSRDFAIGAIAEAGEARHVIASRDALVADLKRRVVDAETHAANHIAHIARLEEALHGALHERDAARARAGDAVALRASATWRAGRFVLLPLRTLRRLVR